LPLLDLQSFQAALPGEGALMGLDPGAKRIGVAVSDATRLVASPLATIARTRMAGDAAAIFGHYQERACVGLVIGLPLNMDGSSGPSAQAARAFARNLLAIRDAPALLWDERLSTAAVTRAMIADDQTRAKRAQNIDKLAAAYVLQGVLDRLRAGAAAPPGAR
jgi:putative Holliday junction resolvase